MKLCCSSQSLDRRLAAGVMDIFDFIRYVGDDLGFDAVEIEDKHITDTGSRSVEEIRRCCAGRALKLANLAFFNSFGYPTRAENMAEVDRAARWMDTATALGTDTFRLFAGWMGGPDRDIGFTGSISPKPSESWTMMAECVALACKEADARGLGVVLENHNHGGFLSVSDDVLRLFSEVRAENLSLLLDTGNYADGLQGIAKTLHLAKRHIHLKCRDIRNDGSDGAFDIAAIIGMIAESGFAGTLSLEYEGVQDEKEVLPRLAAFIRKRLGR